MTSLAELRKNYSLGSLNVGDVDRNPFRQFDVWFEQAVDAKLPEPNTMTLATVDSRGRPSARIVLIKGVDERGFVFFTNYESRKGGELLANPRAALLFHWEPPGRQVRITGTVVRTSPRETEAYVRTRPRASQLSALASPQSQVIAGREELEQRVAELVERYGEGELPASERWGGFRLTPEEIEFWQQRPDRLHDRLRYRRRADGGWTIERLAP
jgi:pyridoxamine 5'-phosphate oxidase